MAQKFEKRKPIDSDNAYGLRKELVIPDGHVPFYEVILLNSLEDVRRAIIHSDDGGLASLQALYCALPSEIRSMFSDLPGEIEYQGRVRYGVRRSIGRRKMTLPASNIPRLEYNPSSGRIEEKFDKPRTILAPYLKPDRKFVIDCTPRQVKRQFVMTWFIKIFNVLEARGLLAKSRYELIGGEE